MKITFPVEEKAAQYYGRPFLVVGDGRHVGELMKAITSEEVQKIKHRLGSVNQFIDSNEQLDDLFLCKKLKELYA